MSSGFLAAADAEAAQFDHAVGHDARHFGGFAAGEDAIAGFEPFDHAGDDARDAGLVDLADADVVEKEQRIAAGGEDVVDVHRHQVLAGGFELAVFEQQFQLRAHAITTGDDDRLLVVAEVVTGGKEAEGLVQAAVFLGPLRAAPRCRRRGRRLP